MMKHIPPSFSKIFFSGFSSLWIQMLESAPQLVRNYKNKNKQMETVQQTRDLCALWNRMQLNI